MLSDDACVSHCGSVMSHVGHLFDGHGITIVFVFTNSDCQVRDHFLHRLIGTIEILKRYA